MSITLLGHIYPRNTTLLNENRAANQCCRITLNCRPSHTEMRRTAGLYSNASAFALVSANAAFAFALAFDCPEVGAFAFAFAFES